MNEQQNTAVIKQAYAAFGRGDMPALLALVDENVDWQPVIGAGPQVPMSGRRRGRGEVGKFFEALGKSIAFSVFDPREFVAQGDKVIALGHYTARAIPSGGAFESEWAMVFTLKNAKIVKFVEFSDSAQLNRAFGGES
ncbi:MAG: nuclear transport factor 2 family protein [Opitutaceae bacterium]